MSLPAAAKMPVNGPRYPTRIESAPADGLVSSSMPRTARATKRIMAPPTLSKPRHDFAREQLHRAADLVLGQPTEAHPAQYLPHADRAHGLDVAGDGIGRAEGERFGDQRFPRDLAEPLGHRTKARLQRRMRVLD